MGLLRFAQQFSRLGLNKGARKQIRRPSACPVLCWIWCGPWSCAAPMQTGTGLSVPYLRFLLFTNRFLLVATLGECRRHTLSFFVTFYLCISSYQWEMDIFIFSPGCSSCKYDTYSTISSFICRCFQFSLLSPKNSDDSAVDETELILFHDCTASMINQGL